MGDSTKLSARLQGIPETLTLSVRSPQKRLNFL
jgi:hypothetical protein